MPHLLLFGPRATHVSDIVLHHVSTRTPCRHSNLNGFTCQLANLNRDIVVVIFRRIPRYLGNLFSGWAEAELCATKQNGENEKETSHFNTTLCGVSWGLRARNTRLVIFLVTHPTYRTPKESPRPVGGMIFVVEAEIVTPSGGILRTHNGNHFGPFWHPKQ